MGGGYKQVSAPVIHILYIFPFYSLNIAHFFFTLRNRLKSSNEPKLLFRHRTMYDVRSTLIFFRRPIVLCFRAISQCPYRFTYLLLSTVFTLPNPHIPL